MSWCEANQVDYVFSLARNERLRAEIESPMQEANRAVCPDGKAGAGVHRVLLSDPQELEPESSGGGQRPNRLRANRNPRIRRDLTVATNAGLRPLFMSSSTVPEGTWRIASRAVLSVQRSAQQCDHARQSIRLYLSSLADVLLQACAVWVSGYVNWLCRAAFLPCV